MTGNGWWDRWLDAEGANSLLQNVSEAILHCGDRCPAMTILLKVMGQPAMNLQKKDEVVFEKKD